jgi:outer membrane protein assembly factor BamB
MRMLTFLVLSLGLLRGENWPSFRGLGARGMAESPNLPVSWNVDTGANIVWKPAMPGLGLSSPVVWGDRIFVTTAISSNPNMVFESKLKGEYDNRVDPAEQEFRVLALDKGTGASASLIAAPHRVYATNEDGEVYVIRASRTYEERAVNRMGEPVMATPAASGGTLFIRGTNHLFALRNR